MSSSLYLIRVVRKRCKFVTNFINDCDKYEYLGAKYLKLCCEKVATLVWIPGFRYGFSGLRHEFVPNPVHGKDVLGLVDVRFDFLTEASYVIINRSGGRIGVVPPDLVQKLISSDH